ncbi:DUF4907 domain-containing protein [Maribacter litoralis]|uniref:DUF4907 domain-containing protein n=1 Tax=Maribacter litoralis TaxID=2059726 RepID=A0A653MI11_9FLAO|nr:DUF4907 domain-containing protein [Maribacter litoralis]VXB03904.1 conserved hypothetical protein [Maribacter litoralis]
MSATVKYSLVIVLFLVLGLGYSIYNQPVANENKLFHSQVVDLYDGYGYQIIKGERIIILQEYIPGLPGKQKFTTEKQAQKTANLVLSKLENGKSPILLPSDLAELNISAVEGQ